jgi:hypothetical protein
MGVISPHEGPPSLVWQLLRAHVPITLLIDLVDLPDPDRPNSREILTAEAVADDVAREQAAEHELLRGRGWSDDGATAIDFEAGESAC